MRPEPAGAAARTGLLVILVLLASLSCATRPGWTKRLPAAEETRRSLVAIEADDAADSLAKPADPYATDVRELAGVWERPLDSRYGVGNPRAHSVGLERVQIFADGRYKKLHLYREQVGGEGLQRGFRESGRVARSGVWVLLTAERAESAESQAQTAAAGRAEDIRLPVESEFAWEAAAPSAGMLYYFEPEREEAHPHYPQNKRLPARLTCLAYEAFGEVYDHGIFAGSRFPYDFRSPQFQDALQIWTAKRNQPHAYVYVRR